MTLPNVDPHQPSAPSGKVAGRKSTKNAQPKFLNPKAGNGKAPVPIKSPAKQSKMHKN